MLVLSRKVGQRILIGENISVTIVRVAPNGVRIGIEAPPEFPVIREELADGPEAEGISIRSAEVNEVVSRAKPR